MIQFQCPCGRILEARNEHAGRRTRCPECQRERTIPDPREEFEPAQRPRSSARPGTALGRERRDEGDVDGEPRRPRPKETSTKAILSLILGVLSFWLCILTGIPALVLGIFGLRDIQQRRGRLGGRGLAIGGIITGSLSMVVAGIIVVTPAITNVRRLADKMGSANNLRQIGLALHSYHDRYGRCPPAVVRGTDGKPLYSWRVLLLPFLENDQLYKEFNLQEPWDSPQNRPLLARMPKVFNDPGDRSNDPTTTFYQVLVGPQTAFENPQGPILAEITDGPSYTIMVVEAAEGVPWTKPVDVAYNPKGPLPRFGGHHPGGFGVVLGDGSYRFLSNGTDEALLRALITRNGNEIVPRDF
jgi:hypothetical protein